MTKAEEMCRVFGIILSNRQKYACAYLEARGLSCGKHFDHESCEQRAADLWTKDLDQQARLTHFEQVVRGFTSTKGI